MYVMCTEVQYSYTHTYIRNLLNLLMLTFLYTRLCSMAAPLAAVTSLCFLHVIICVTPATDVATFVIVRLLGSVCVLVPCFVCILIIIHANISRWLGLLFVNF